MTYIVSAAVLDLNAEICAIDDQITSETDAAKIADLRRAREALADVCMDLLAKAVKVKRQRKGSTQDARGFPSQ